MRKSRKEKIQDIRVSEKSEFSTWPLQNCFFKVQCKMNSDAGPREKLVDFYDGGDHVHVWGLKFRKDEHIWGLRF